MLSVTPLLDPADPNNDTNEAMTLYKEQVAKYASDADVTDGIVAYGWTTGALLVKILESSAKLDRVSVMKTARTLDRREGRRPPAPDVDVEHVGADDWFLGETFQLVQYDAAAKHTNAGRRPRRPRRQDRRVLAPGSDQLLAQRHAIGPRGPRGR